LLLPLGSSASLAFADPPDATWITGIYDGGDRDDAIAMITGMTATADVPVAGLETILPLVSDAVRPGDSAVRDCLSSSRQPRAPPGS
jgi:hypothetical protein